MIDNQAVKDSVHSRIGTIVGNKFIPPPDISEGNKMILQKNFELAN